MTQSAHPLPPPRPAPDGVAAWRPVDPAGSGATRLLCAGVYLDPVFRRRVIDELYVHEERVVAPSYGIDAARVLAHALRARRMEFGSAVVCLLVWCAAVKLSGGLFAVLLLPSLLLGVADRLRRRAREYVTGPDRLGPLTALWWYAALVMALEVTGLFVTAWQHGHEDRSVDGWVGLFNRTCSYVDFQYWLFSSGLREMFRERAEPDVGGHSPAWGLLLFLLVLAGAAGLRRGAFARTMAGPLSTRRFGPKDEDLSERAVGARFERIARAIRAGQHSPLITYGVEQPFLGAGVAHKAWHMTVELRPRDGVEQDELTNQKLLERVVPRIEKLRVPSPRSDSGAPQAVLDRLRELVVDECVFLPVTQVRRRSDVPQLPGLFARHRAESVEEGGEERRHFLRIRVGGWQEDVVVTVFVRVHTQGGMLMLEVAPHVLLPVRRAFRRADEIAARHRDRNVLAKGAWALAHAPDTLLDGLLGLFHGLRGLGQVLGAPGPRARAAAPRLAVRELASARGASLFQDMDVDRYVKTVQDRITSGVALALDEAGYETKEFERKTVSLGAGSLYIESVHGSAVAFGDKATARNRNETRRARADRDALDED
ncbi:hypothetical protein [Streptomyces sp. NPDC089919]|uniref:hypothetical protein n=1 Tax=Streptomyces sp. NPDC089919 TaxID=3155188 RepID=UPI00341B90C2